MPPDGFGFGGGPTVRLGGPSARQSTRPRLAESAKSQALRYDGTMTPVAGIDVGTNSVRLLIIDESGGEIERCMQITRLGQGVDETGKLAPEALERTLRVLDDYGQRMARHGVKRVRATATSAARDAKNREALFAPARDILTRATTSESALELLSGADEARLSFQGASADLSGEDTVLVFDIGGGSTEFALGKEAPEAFISIDMGGVRVTERFLSNDPPRTDEIAAAEGFVQAQCEKVGAAIPVHKASRVLGLAGTVTTFAALQLQLAHYDATRTHGLALTRQQIERIAEQLLTSTIAERRAILLEPKRAEVIVGGAIVLRTLMRYFDFNELQVSEKDILDGLAASLLNPGS